MVADHTWCLKLYHLNRDYTPDFESSRALPGGGLCTVCCFTDHGTLKSILNGKALSYTSGSLPRKQKWQC